jgi:hypothetical protein
MYTAFVFGILYSVLCVMSFMCMSFARRRRWFMHTKLTADVWVLLLMGGVWGEGKPPFCSYPTVGVCVWGGYLHYIVDFRL